MPRIMGIDIPKEKKIEIALTYIYGIGRALSNRILQVAGINPDTRAKNLTEEEIAKLTGVIQKEAKVEGDLRREVSQNIKRYIEIGSWHGIRHKRGLPTRGQRTKTNARTRKGPRKTIGARKARVTETAKPAQ